MTRSRNTIIFGSAGIVIGVILIFSGIAFIFGGRDKSAPEQEAVGKTVSAAGFSFLDLDKQTRFSAGLRNRLRDALGNESIESSTLIDLTTAHRGFLAAHFPDLDALNTQLNSDSGARIEHNIVKLMFRYARRKNLPFDYVELVFSNYTDLPLYFRIRTRGDSPNISATLEEKYGQPDRVIDSGALGSSLAWEKDGDVLIASRVLNRLGVPEYQVMYYYTDHLNDLLATEIKLKKERTAASRARGKAAF